MKLIILGSNGMMGSMLVFYCKKFMIEHQAYSKSDFNVLMDPVETLQAKLTESSKSYVFINCIGCIPQRKYTEEEYLKINQQFPHELAEFCQKHSYRLVHVSTDCVFSGKLPNRCESDITDSPTLYGRTKYKGEPVYGTTIRCSILGPERSTGFGFFSWFLTAPDATINGFVNHFWNGVTTYELASDICRGIQDNTLPDGLVHVFSQNTLSKYHILKEIQVRSRKAIQIVPFENELKYYTLSSSKTQARPTIEEQLDMLFSILPEYTSNN
jgi:dTDP-4-dehydrorhamnose reductase